MTARCTGTVRAREAEDGSRAGIRPRGGPTQGHLHVLEDRAGALNRSREVGWGGVGWGEVGWGGVGWGGVGWGGVGWGGVGWGGVGWGGVGWGGVGWGEVWERLRGSACVHEPFHAHPGSTKA